MDRMMHFRLLMVPVFIPLHFLAACAATFIHYLTREGLWWSVASVIGVVTGVSLIVIPVVAAIRVGQRFGDYRLGRLAFEDWFKTDDLPIGSKDTNDEDFNVKCICGQAMQISMDEWMPYTEKDGTNGQKRYVTYTCSSCGREEHVVY